MAYDIGAGDLKPSTGDSQQEVEQPRSIRPNNADVVPTPPNKETNKPNWVEKGNLIVLGLTFAAALYAGCEAKRLADLTEVLIVDARDTAKRQLRAHVLYDGVIANQLKNTAAISIRFKNGGTTPAYETTYWWNVKAFTPTEVGNLEFFDTGKVSLDIGAGGFLDTDEREIPFADVDEARKGNTSIFGASLNIETFSRDANTLRSHFEAAQKSILPNGYSKVLLVAVPS